MLGVGTVVDPWCRALRGPTIVSAGMVSAASPKDCGGCAPSPVTGAAGTEALALSVAISVAGTVVFAVSLVIGGGPSPV